jgi:tricorn protease
VHNFYELMENTAGRAITLTVNDKPTEDGAHDEQVRPIARETNLRYLDWVQSRRELVDRLSDGRIGYIHLPNTAGAGNRELRKYFYPQAHKDALVIDVRYNGGGFIPDRMIELVARKHLSFWARRGVDPSKTPGYAHVGPKACLINAYSSSGGDAFPYYFRLLELGPLIGKRTWGGLIGLSGNPGFLDGGSVSVPTFRFYDADGNWQVENEGVAPDVEVLDRPDLVARGADPTLEQAVELLLEELDRNPVERATPPTPPR